VLNPDLDGLAARLMALLFSYGSLQRAEVQHATFGRTLDGAHDELAGWRVVPASPPGIPHANAIRSQAAARVAGTAYLVTDAELSAADEYEKRDGYVRVAVRLVSGKEGWIYVDARTVDA